MDKLILAGAGSVDAATQRRRMLFGVGIASFLGCIDFTVVNTAIPLIQTGLHADVAHSQWIVTSFLIALCSSMVIAGRLADRYGRRRLLYIGMGLFGLSSLGAGLASHIAVLIAFRFLQGTACAALYTASAAMVSNAFPEDQRGRAMGILFGVNGMGLAVGPIVGGVLATAGGWRSIFLVNIPLIALCYLICLRNAQESRSQERVDLDWPGLFLLVPGLTALVLGLVKGIDWGWTAMPTLAAFAASAVLLAALARWERTVRAPLIDIASFANKRFMVAAIATSGLAFFYCAAFFLMPQYLHIIERQDALMIGTMLLPTTVTMALASPPVGRLADRLGPVPLLLAGFSLLAASAALQAGFSGHDSLAYVVMAFAAMGLGWACLLGPSTVAAVGSVPESRSGVAVGASWTIHNLGGAVGLSIATMVYRAVAVSPLAGSLSPASFLDGYRAAMGVLLGVALLAAAAIALLSNTQSGLG